MLFHYIASLLKVSKVLFYATNNYLYNSVFLYSLIYLSKLSIVDGSKESASYKIGIG